MPAARLADLRHRRASADQLAHELLATAAAAPHGSRRQKQALYLGLGLVGKLDRYDAEIEGLEAVERERREIERDRKVVAQLAGGRVRVVGEEE